GGGQGGQVDAVRGHHARGRPGPDDRWPADQVPQGGRLRAAGAGPVQVGGQVTGTRPPQMTPRLQASGVRKQFPGVLALDGVSLGVAGGEVLAVVGENGAGKSTLRKVLAGVYQADAGSVELDGQPVHFTGPADAMRAGVSLIHQELNLAENLSVTDNLFLGREPTRGGLLRVLDRRRSADQARELIARVGLPQAHATARV